MGLKIDKFQQQIRFEKYKRNLSFLKMTLNFLAWAIRCMIVLIVEIRNTKGGDFGGGEEDKVFCFGHAEFEVHVSLKGQDARRWLEIQFGDQVATQMV